MFGSLRRESEHREHFAKECRPTPELPREPDGSMLARHTRTGRPRCFPREGPLSSRSVDSVQPRRHLSKIRKRTGDALPNHSVVAGRDLPQETPTTAVNRLYPISSLRFFGTAHRANERNDPVAPSQIRIDRRSSFAPRPTRRPLSKTLPARRRSQPKKFSGPCFAVSSE